MPTDAWHVGYPTYQPVEGVPKFVDDHVKYVLGKKTPPEKKKMLLNLFRQRESSEQQAKMELIRSYFEHPGGFDHLPALTDLKSKLEALVVQGDISSKDFFELLAPLKKNHQCTFQLVDLSNAENHVMFPLKKMVSARSEAL